MVGSVIGAEESINGQKPEKVLGSFQFSAFRRQLIKKKS